MLKFRVAYYILLVILLSKEITGRSQFFDIFNEYDDESYEDKDTNVMEKHEAIFSDWLPSIFDYFYDDSDDGDDKYLICKNCTVIVGENQSHTSTQTASSTTQAATTMTTNDQSSTQPATTMTTNDQSSTQPATTVTTNDQSSTQPATTVTTNDQSTTQAATTVTTNDQSSSSSTTQPTGSTDGSIPADRQ